MPKSSSGLSNVGNSSTEAQEKTLRRIIRQTAGLKNEQYRIIDRDGNVTLTRKGTEHEVMSTVGDKRDLLKGALSIHNHPNGGPFSADDLREFGYGATQIVVATPEGTYRLINNRVGTPTQYNGWYDMQEAMRNTIKEADSSLTYRKQAQANLKNSRELRAMNRITKQYMDERGQGASQTRLNQLWGQYQQYEERYKARLAKETRRLEVKPYHDFYRKHAREYGFTYVAPKYW